MLINIQVLIKNFRLNSYFLPSRYNCNNKHIKEIVDIEHFNLLS